MEKVQLVKVMLFKPSGKWAYSYEAQIPEKYWETEEAMLEEIDKVQTSVHKGTYKNYITVITDYSGNNFVLGLYYPKNYDSSREIVGKVLQLTTEQEV